MASAEHQGWPISCNTMIDFVCPHCDRPAQVDDSAAGETRRCPLCSKIVAVPARPQDSAAIGGTEVSGAAAQQMPRASKASDDSLSLPDDLDLPSRQGGSLDETDILPALQNETNGHVEQPKSWRELLGLSKPQTRDKNAARRKRMLVFAIVVLVVLIGLAAAVFLVTGRS